MLVCVLLVVAGCVDARGERGYRDDPVMLSYPGAYDELAEDASPQAGVKGDPPVPKRRPQEAEALALAGPEIPERLVGMNFEDAKSILGEPALLIEEPPAKIWAYNGSECVLHVFFYPKLSGGEFRVLTFQVLGGDSASDTGSSEFQRRCFSELLADARVAQAEQQQQNATEVQ